MTSITIKQVLDLYIAKIRRSFNPARVKTQSIEFFEMLYECDGISEVMKNYCIKKIEEV